MKVLFIGGTGIISAACAREAVRRGIEVHLLNRGRHPERTPEGATWFRADINDGEQVLKTIGKRTYDCVVDWVAFTPDQAHRDVDLFTSRTEHYIFISSASVYQKPPEHWVISEEMPVGNPFWRYARDKIACEKVLLDAHDAGDFPVTIVRPSHTYSDGWVPTPIGSRDFTIAQRMLDGQAVISPGDGQALWTLTHSEDFARGFTDLMGNPGAVGEVFHITSDEARTWDAFYRIIGEALGVEPLITHIPSGFVNKVSPILGQGLLGDKAYSMVFDNSRIRRLVPGFKALIPFHEGIRRSLAWFKKSEDRKMVDRERNREIEKVLEDWGKRMGEKRIEN